MNTPVSGYAPFIELSRESLRDFIGTVSIKFSSLNMNIKIIGKVQS